MVVFPDEFFIFVSMDITFKIEYRTRWGESIALVLNDTKYPMTWTEGGIWTVTVNATAASLKDYTYVVIEDGLITRAEWKHHRSRQAAVIEDVWNACPMMASHFTRSHQAAVFDVPGFHGAGLAVPVFSLRSADDFGIGEFRDLKPLVDFAAKTGMCIIQLLPVNDTTREGSWKDSYPYSPVSSFALHPLYVHLQDLGVEETPAFRKKQKELNSLKELDYPKVFKAKMQLIRKAFEARGKADMEDPAFVKFVKDNKMWLKPYCSFCAERDKLEPEYYAWLQWHLERQFAEVVDYARSKGVFFKGDLPIGVSADSAEAHYHPDLFNLDSSAGAPPDFFSRDGQNWGFPTYNWDAMEKNGYAWWKARLRKMSRFFDAFRIDHILGFFRIWEIPNEFPGGLMGHFNPALPYGKEEIDSFGLPLDGLFLPDPRHPGMYQPMITPDTSNLEQWQKNRFQDLYNDFFYHRHNGFWRRNAEKKLPELLGATGMLACGEDLGMVPDCVPGVMDHERILSLKMRGMENEGEWKYLSVCATSSHDMETLRMQFEEDPSPEQVKDELSRFLNSPSMLAIFPLQDWVALDGGLRSPDRDERINQPADSNHHWRYRIHFNVEELVSDAALADEIRSMLDSSARIHR